MCPSDQKQQISGLAIEEYRIWNLFSDTVLRDDCVLRSSALPTKWYSKNYRSYLMSINCMSENMLNT